LIIHQPIKNTMHMGTERHAAASMHTRTGRVLLPVPQNCNLKNARVTGTTACHGRQHLFKYPFDPTHKHRPNPMYYCAPVDLRQAALSLCDSQACIQVNAHAKVSK
jgi:hypothetical protein